MMARSIFIGLALLVSAIPVAAQQRGTVEFGGFASGTDYDYRLGIQSGWGGGGRVGAYLYPRLSVEFEGGGANADRGRGLLDVNVGVLSGRLTAVPVQFGRFSALLGLGGDHIDTHFLESYGVHGLVGAKIAITPSLAFRADAIQGYMVNGGGWNSTMHVGLAAYRSPGTR